MITILVVYRKGKRRKGKAHICPEKEGKGSYHMGPNRIDLLGLGLQMGQGAMSLCTSNWAGDPSGLVVSAARLKTPTQSIHNAGAKKKNVNDTRL